MNMGIMKNTEGTCSGTGNSHLRDYTLKILRLCKNAILDFQREYKKITSSLTFWL
jgi:hypothetical protein